jgi:DNA-binding transcriptional LysR family regulator
VDLRHLRTFVCVAEQGTVSKASLRLHVAQPALSRQINDLEEELDVRLFDRVRGRLVLTGEGEQLLGYCRSVLGAVTALGERAELLKRPDTGVLKVAATPQMIDGVFSGFLHRYARQRPHVEVKLTEAVGPSLLTMLERGELHIGISLMQAVEADSHAFELFPLPPIEFLAACHVSLPIGATGQVEIRRLAAHPLLLLDPTFVVRRTFDAACRVAGLRPDVFLESRTPHALLALAEAGHGIAIVPSVLPTHRYRLRILRITHRRRPLREPLAVLWDKRRARPRFAGDFCESLAAYMREVFPISKPVAPTAAAKRATARPR